MSVALVLSFFINPIGASDQAWGAIATVRGLVPDHDRHLPSTFGSVAGQQKFLIDGGLYFDTALRNARV
jgi:hypothetical protein